MDHDIDLEKNGLIAGFARSCKKYPDRQALFVNKHYFTYSQLLDIVIPIAAAIGDIEQPKKTLACFLGYRSSGAYASLLGILWSGRGYVPLNPHFPIERLAKILTIVDASTLVVCEECFSLLPSLLPLLKKNINLVLLDYTSTSESISYVNVHKTAYISAETKKIVSQDPPEINDDDIAYLLFTSGSTGTPKGVPIIHRSIRMYLDYMSARYGFSEEDRFSQSCEMSFDVSLLEMFCCWENGACSYCIPKSSLMLPAKFIKDHALTVWVSVPSVGVFLNRMRLLKPKLYPSLRYCFLLGEHLPASITSQWQRAAENAIIENQYGPTEATVAITHYRWNEIESPAQCINGIAPIGWVFGSQSGCVVDEQLRPVPRGTKGELCLAGGQLSKGYYHDPEKTKQQFVKIEGDDRTWYRTGDVVIESEDGRLNCLGRIDFQVKILGNRVELQEIEYALRAASAEDHAVAIPWPPNKANAEKIIGVIATTSDADGSAIIAYCKKILPHYMVPASIVFVKNMPLNSNGKIDRLKVTEIIGEKNNARNQK